MSAETPPPGRACPDVVHKLAAIRIDKAVPRRLGACPPDWGEKILGMPPAGP
jgi:hypothetical protein